MGLPLLFQKIKLCLSSIKQTVFLKSRGCRSGAQIAVENRITRWAGVLPVHVSHLIRLLNGALGYQSRADQGVPDETFVPQLHHQTRFQMIDLAKGTEDSALAVKPVGGAVYPQVCLAYSTLLEI